MTSPRTAEPRQAALGSSGDEKAMLLAERAVGGDLAAIQQLIALVWPAINRVVASVLGSRAPDVEDVVQQSLIALLRALPAFRGECHPVGYASRIAVREALRARRRHHVEASRLKSLERQALDPEDSTANADPAAERRRQLLRGLLADLPEEQAEALALRVVLGWSLEEVARESGVPTNTVRSRVRLAKEALWRRIEATPELFDELGLEP
jgi:RNA polymerase sigma factor (sigma-70 family)